MVTASFATLALVAAASVVFALVVVLLLSNFKGGEAKIERRIERLHSIEDQRFAYEIGVLLGPPFLDGNRIRPLVNGENIFPAMLAAIRDAKASINFETFIYWAGAVGREFAEALSERARQGVKVNVLLDWVGSVRMDDSLIDTLTAAGVRVRRFHPPHWTHLGRLNHRTHRKLLIVDGRVGFTGGVGVAPQWTGHAQDPDHWRDTHYLVEGPVVAQMQSVFLDNWIKVTGDVLHGTDFFPDLTSPGNTRAQMFSSSPSGGSESMQLMYLLALTAASRSIDLSAAYFVPDKLTMRALTDAMKRGVRLRVVVPGKHIDSDIARRASHASWGPLLAAGATIAEYERTMYHCKLLVIDGLLVSVGSTNFDNRSFRMNDEATLNIVDQHFATEQTALFEADLAHAQQMTHAQWLERPVLDRFKEAVASLFRSQL